jgi:hypothetical protein
MPVARIRSIKPEFPQSESMGRVSREARLCFILLWTIADDSGRLRGNSRMLASLLFPYDGDAPRLIDRWLAELESEKCVIRYKVNGDHYMEICNWLLHQKIDRPSKSKIVPFANVREDSPTIREDSSGDQRIKGSKEGIEEGTGTGRDAGASRGRATLEEVAAYCQERSNGIDPQEFFDHYETCGWVQGRARKPIKNWQAAVRTWEKSREKQAPQSRLPSAADLENYNVVDGGLGVQP